MFLAQKLCEPTSSGRVSFDECETYGFGVPDAALRH